MESNLLCPKCGKVLGAGVTRCWNPGCNYTVSPGDLSFDCRERLAQRLDRRVAEILANYGWGAMGAMVAIPIPGADMAATAGVWGKMICEIARVYGENVSSEDAGRLSSSLFKSVILTTFAWFGSAKILSNFAKFLPGPGTLAGYLIDASVAGYGAKDITARLGTAAALYYKSGKTMAPETLASHVKTVFANKETILKTLSLVALGTDISGLKHVSNALDGFSDLG